MLRIEDQDPISLGKKIKDLYPKKPVVLLAFDETELKQLPNNISPNAINRVFIWSGDAVVFPAIIKYIEDRKLSSILSMDPCISMHGAKQSRVKQNRSRLPTDPLLEGQMAIA